MVDTGEGTVRTIDPTLICRADLEIMQFEGWLAQSERFVSSHINSRHLDLLRMAEHATGDRWQYRYYTSAYADPHNGVRRGNADHSGRRDDAGNGLGSQAKSELVHRENAAHARRHLAASA